MNAPTIRQRLLKLPLSLYKLFYDDNFNPPMYLQNSFCELIHIDDKFFTLKIDHNYKNPYITEELEFNQIFLDNEPITWHLLQFVLNNNKIDYNDNFKRYLNHINYLKFDKNYLKIKSK